MTLLVPQDNPYDYDVIRVAGQFWGGICLVEGCEKIYDWQKNKGKKASGATLNFGGPDLAEPKLTFVLWKGVDGLGYADWFAEWDKFRAVFDISVDQDDPRALPIEHPQFALAGIKSVVVKKIGDMKIQSDGRVHIEVDTIEFRKPKTITGSGTPKQEGKAGSSAANGPKPMDVPPWDKIREKQASVKRKGNIVADGLANLGKPK